MGGCHVENSLFGYSDAAYSLKLNLIELKRHTDRWGLHECTCRMIDVLCCVSSKTWSTGRRTFCFGTSDSALSLASAWQHQHTVPMIRLQWLQTLIASCAGGCHNMPPPRAMSGGILASTVEISYVVTWTANQSGLITLTFDLLTLTVVSESCVTWASLSLWQF